MKSGEFRRWVHEQWLQNRDELADYHQPQRSYQDYWQEYRAWLRDQFRLEQRKQS